MFVKITFHYRWNVGVVTLAFVGRFENTEAAEAWISGFTSLVPSEQVMAKFEVTKSRDFGFQFYPDSRQEQVLEEMTEPFEVYARRATRLKA